MTSMAESSERQLFGDALVCTLNVPVVLRPGLSAVDAVEAVGLAEALLRNIARVEDNQPEDAQEDRSVAELALQRVEAKLDLLLGVIGRLLGQDGDFGPLRQLRWSHLGCHLVYPGSWQLGDAALLSVPVAGWLAQPLELPVRVLAAEAVEGDVYQLWLAIDPLNDALVEAVKRYLFRLHRRAIAEDRRSR